MCLLLLLHKIAPGWPIVVGANRDEELDRESIPPIRWPGEPESFAPVDARSAGTWIGINERGVFVGITNRPTDRIDLARRSRGLLCRDALRGRSAGEAEEIVRDELHRSDYNPFNLLVADADHALVVHFADEVVRTAALSPGVHVLTNFQDVDSIFLREVVAAFDVEAASRRTEAKSLIDAIAPLLRDHEIRVPGDHAICKHLGERGTVSSTIALLRAGSWAGGRFLYADGPPCRTPFHDLSKRIEQIRE
ncbi:MAG: NRDE family protein [Planctomycetes bacterium]|nr:NRDE family protein [Planctomycetota bacterium]MBI3845732.1 NRDE family protein [Planctomycetota bacterium]